MTAVVTVFGAILTWAHVVVLLMVLIVETGTSLMELDCHSLEMAVSFKTVGIRELTYTIVVMLPPQQVSTAA